MKKIFPLLLLCTAIAFAACSSDDDKDEPIAVTGVVLDQSALSLEVGKTATLVATISPEDAVTKEVTWSSSATDVATVADGVVTAMKAGDAIITVTTKDGGKTATCTVTVTAAAIEWAVGNLAADGANGAKIATATDKSLYFQFGSLIGWSEAGDDPTIAVKPAAFNGGTRWNGFWTGDPATDNAATGTGDPCRYYLKGTWRLPTKDEYEKLFENSGYPSAGPWKWENSSATNNTKNLTFPASGYRHSGSGRLVGIGIDGYCWSASPYASNGYLLYFSSSNVNPSSDKSRASGLPVRCVQNASN